MRLSMAALSAMFITLLLFLTMLAMIRSQEPRLLQPPSGQAVALIDLAGLLRAASKPADTPTELAATPPLDAPPSMPDLVRPPTSLPALSTPDVSMPQTLASIPEIPLDLAGLEMPRRPKSARPNRLKQTRKSTPDRSPARRQANAVPTRRQPRPQPAGAADSAPAIGDPATAKVTGNSQPTLAHAGNGSDSDARPLKRVEPVYPRKAARAGQEGWVRLAFTITRSGDVKDVVVVDAQPRRVFERSAQRALRQWRFQPRLVNGQPVARQATQVIEFTLAGRG